MPACPPWFQAERDDQLPLVVAGLAEFYRFIIAACKKRYIVGHGDIKTYHEKVFKKVVPLGYYAGNYRSRDQARPCLAQDVQVDGVRGEAFLTVPDSMRDFSSELHDLVVRTDEYLQQPVSATERAQAIAQLAAVAMGRFIRIHPFLNGNGRMVRMLVNYIFKRYGYPMPFNQAQIRPPENEYALASSKSMGPAPDPNPLYVYLLRLVARAASS